MPAIWPYILERKFNALLENGVHFVNIAGGKGDQIYLCQHPFRRLLQVVFKSRPTPYFVIFHTYSDDINFLVPPIWPYILKRKFNALLENGVHFVNIAGEKGIKFTFVDTHFGSFCEFFWHRTTPYFVIFQTYSDEINFIVPPIWPSILERKFNALL